MRAGQSPLCGPPTSAPRSRRCLYQRARFTPCADGGLGQRSRRPLLIQSARRARAVRRQWWGGYAAEGASDLAALQTGGNVMRDYLAWRMAFGVTTPSTHPVVQPEYDDMRPEGVTNHIARMVIADNPVHSDADFAKQIEDIDAALEDAVDRIMDAKPNAFILGISALSVWGGNVEWGEE